MNTLLELVRQGGPVMYPLIALSLLMYERCLHLLWLLAGARRRAPAAAEARALGLVRVQRLQADLVAAYQRQRMLIGAFIAAAPLLGLLGTVMGMVNTFDSLATETGQRSMEGLARGISMALITTETGLAIAIPAVMILYYAHRQLQKGLQRLVLVEGELREAIAP